MRHPWRRRRRHCLGGYLLLDHGEDWVEGPSLRVVQRGNFFLNSPILNLLDSGTRVMDSSIEALDTRLRRLEYILTGSTNTVDTTSKPDSQRTNIPNQLSSLNDRLAKLANTNKSIKKLLQACTSPHTSHRF